MASAKFLEDALSTDVDESAVNAIVGSLENQLVTSSTASSSQNNIVNINHVNSSGSSIIASQNYNADRSNFNEVKQANSVIFSCSVPNTSVPYNDVQTSLQSNYISSVPNVSQGPLSTTSKPSDPIKVIYSQTSPIPNRLITFPAPPYSNGNLAVAGSQYIVQSVSSGGITSQAHKTVTMQPPLVIKQGTTSGQLGIQSGGQNIVTSTQNMAASGQPTIIPSVQILNVRPGTPGVQAQKSVATVSPRVVIGSPQVVGARAAAPGITLQTLQGLQPGQQGHLLLKTENGQYQLLRVGPAPAASTLTAPQAQTIRLSTVPAHPGVATVSTSVPPVQMQSQQMPTAPVAAPIVAATVAPVAAQPPTVTTQKPSDNTKEKCRNFLANLLDLSSKEPKSVERNVRNLIQELIDAQVEPEEFCDRLERLLNASPQPCLIGFLKKSLPLLRQSLVAKELVIEGINAPSPHVAFSNVAAATQPVIAASNVQMTNDGMVNCNGGTLTSLMPAVVPVVSISTPTLVQGQAGKINIISTSQIQPPQTSQVTQHKPTPSKPGGTIAVLQNIPIQAQKINLNKVSSSKAGSVVGKFSRPGGASASLSTVLTPGKSLLKEKEKKASSQYSSQQFADDKMAGDDDINDVAAMGGVNLAEESQRILGSTELIGTQIRSCKDEYLLPMNMMCLRVKAAAARHELEEPPTEVAGLVSHALHERLKNLVEKLAVIAQHRIDLIIKTDPRYEVTQDVKGQLKFLEELDRVEKKRREDSEREILMRAAKSRSKNEDPEQAKLKAKAKEMQRAELEELRQREANLTALQAIGPRKKPKLDGPGGGGGGDAVSNGGPNTTSGFSGRSQLALRTRLKRINQRDLMFLMEQERETAHSPMLYKCYLK